MSATTTILRCPNCRQRLRVPGDRGELTLTCPRCRWRWDWAPREAEILFLDDGPPARRDSRLRRALDIFEEFERRRTEGDRPADLWDEWLDGPRPG